MKILFELIEESTIEQFADKHGLTMKVIERPKKWDLPRYCAWLQNIDTKEGECFLRGDSGNGNTVAEAIKDYAKAISLKTVVLHAGTPQRREINVPRLTD